MPSAEEHRAQAAENEAFYAELRDTRPDWALTVLFYVIVHEIQAFLADRRGTIIGYGLPWPITNHHERKAALRRHPPWARLASYYGSFEGWSRKTRYECFKPDPQRLTEMEGLLARIRAEIQQLP